MSDITIQKEAVAELKRTKATIDTALQRIETLESCLKGVMSDVKKIEEVFGPGMKINWFYGGSWKDIEIRAAFQLVKDSITKVLG